MSLFPYDEGLYEVVVIGKSAKVIISFNLSVKILVTVLY